MEKLVRLFHPDKHQKDLEKRKKYEKLTAYINLAKEEGDLDTLEKIASDPEAFCAKRGIGILDFSDETEKEADSLQRLWNALQSKIISVIQAIEELKQTPEHEIYIISEKNRTFLNGVIEKQQSGIEKEINSLRKEANSLKHEIEQLTGDSYLD